MARWLVIVFTFTFTFTARKKTRCIQVSKIMQTIVNIERKCAASRLYPYPLSIPSRCTHHHHEPWSSIVFFPYRISLIKFTNLQVVKFNDCTRFGESIITWPSAHTKYRTETQKESAAVRQFYRANEWGLLVLLNCIGSDMQADSFPAAKCDFELELVRVGWQFLAIRGRWCVCIQIVYIFASICSASYNLTNVPFFYFFFFLSAFFFSFLLVHRLSRLLSFLFFSRRISCFVCLHSF